MREHLPSDQQIFGEIYINTAVLGAVKGYHYHTQTTEWFCVLSGQVVLGLYDTRSGNQAKISLDGDSPNIVRVPAFVAHGLKNVGLDTAMFLVYADTPYEPEHPDAERFDVFGMID